MPNAATNREEEAGLIARPTVVGTAPEPVRHIVGGLSDREALIPGLDLEPAAIPEPEDPQPMSPRKADRLQELEPVLGGDA